LWFNVDQDISEDDCLVLECISTWTITASRIFIMDGAIGFEADLSEDIRKRTAQAIKIGKK
jgi:hypothetical protein